MVRGPEKVNEETKRNKEGSEEQIKAYRKEYGKIAMECEFRECKVKKCRRNKHRQTMKHIENEKIKERR